jgi:dipeptidyl aminopeptidase/acylaminoacyl peptidase
LATGVRTVEDQPRTRSANPNNDFPGAAMLRILFALLFTFPAFAEPARTHDITIDDYGTLATIRELAVSPDGKFVAYTEARWDKADDLQKTDLWVVATDGKGKPTRLTGDRENDRHPKWSRDGKAIYVLGNRKREAETKPPYDGKTQVWRVPLDGGSVQPVAKVEGGVAGFDYAPKADALFYSVDATATDNDEFTALRNKHKAEYGHGSRKVSEVYRLDLQSWRTKKIIADGRYIREFAVTQDGKRVAMISCIDDTVVKSEGESRVDIWEDGKVVTPPTDVYRAKAASPYAWLESLAWNPEGTRLAFCAVFDAYPAEIIVHTLKDGKWIINPKDNPTRWALHVRGYGSPIKWGSDDWFTYLIESSGSMSIIRISVKYGNDYHNANSGEVISAFDRNGYAEFWVRSTPAQFPQLFFFNHGEPNAPAINVNPHTSVWRLPSIKHITWKAPDGTQVGGVLELPFGYKQGDKLPLVVGIHGGPTTSTKAELSYDPHNGRLYFAAHGYAALFPNYRGSTGYPVEVVGGTKPDEFVTDLIGHENDIEVKDILAGIQHLIKEGIADPERIGVMGWSNGGYLTNCLITLKDSPVKFKAASTGGCILDTVAEWGFNDEPAYPIVFKKGLPWEQPDIYRKTSPVYGLGNVTTPTLIHVGGNDPRCPPGHSRMFYRALKEYRNVPTELVVYPGEPHGLTKLSNRKAKMEWDLAWFDKYVKGR